ncbi:MAG TPA: type I-E CRISPR-associated protein Cas5/CasD [Methylococcus sp.]|nr:type I-E CRISPR-associated protein Cas5/CasD [Methylococcus sp.]
MDCLLLRLDAPLMSFGGVVVDQINPIERFPGRSMLAGLLANALGWDHRDAERIDALQARLKHAARWDVEPERLVDYHTVDLSEDFLVDTGWTTRGYREDRKGGSAGELTHQRWRHYWANGIATVALTVTGEDAPTLADLEVALLQPARPLFIGRKTCLPANPVLLGRREAESLRAALCAEPLADPGPRPKPSRVSACWPIEEGEGREVREVYDLRDWRNNLHRGSLRYAQGFLEAAP